MMTEGVRRVGLLAPFRVPVFRRIWPASLLSNFGIMIQGVGSAWTMAQLTHDPSMVALVQASIMAPIMLFALPSGAVSDLFDRRLVCICALLIALAGATGLCVTFALGVISPAAILIFCFLVGAGSALFSPSWQASVAEQVPPDALPSAIALNGISYNLARSFGPTIGGVLVAAVGALGAFLANALFYLPVLAALLLWRRRPETRSLAPETLGRAIVSGVRFICLSPTHRLFVLRTFVFAFIGGVLPALMPLIARDLLQGDATVYGLLLGAFGFGAVVGVIGLPWMRSRLTTEASSRLSAVCGGLAIVVVCLSRTEALTGAALLVAGMAWTNALTLFSISIQISAARWVAGRALSAYQATVAAGVAVGSVVWGACADRLGVANTLLTAGCLLAASALLGVWLRLPDAAPPAKDHSLDRNDPDIALDITPRGGPLVIEIDHVVPPENAHVLHEVMRQVRRYR